jgi:predicted phosphodiesterase
MQIKQYCKRFMLKYVFSLLIVMTALCMPAIASAGTYNATGIVMTPGTDMARINFNWYSTSNTNCLVQVALKSAMQGSVFPVDSSNSYYCITASAASGYYSNKAVVTSLSLSTEYVYRIGDGNGNWTANYFFTTHDDDQFSFLAVGDPQIGAASTSSDTAGWDDTLTEAFNEFPDADFIMSAGDQVETKNSEAQFSGFLSPSEIKSLPVVPALGNHDNGAANTGYHFNLPNLSTYGVTSPGSSDYYFTHGNAIIMVLNSNNSSGASHGTFIENTLAANPGYTWKIVMFHHDIYGSGSHALEQSVSNLRAALFPVFDENDIDIVITGHDHSYTRTHVMYGDVAQLNQTYDENGAVINPNGTVYFTLNSSSGSKYYSLNSTQASYVAVRSQINVPTFSHITINGNTLAFDTYRTDTMAQTDTYSILKTGEQTGAATIERAISSGTDDVEEIISNGSVNNSSTDLELSCDGSNNQIVGMRFSSITIPQGSLISNAYIQFTCDETSSTTANLTIYGQDTGNASAFSTTSYNVSSRTQTSEQVSWSPSAWSTANEKGANQRTPYIKDIIQEIVDRADWLSGNSIAILITGTSGSIRCAKSYNGSSTNAPLLHIEYTTN